MSKYAPVAIAVGNTLLMVPFARQRVNRATAGKLFGIKTDNRSATRSGCGCWAFSGVPVI